MSNDQCEKICQTIPEEYCFQAFNFCSKRGFSSEGYSGTAIISKVQPINVEFGMLQEEMDTEGRIITMEFDEFYLVNCYAPNAGK